MPVIITATDFSDVSENAVNYACQLAADHKATVTVIHTFIIPVTFSDSPMPVVPIDEAKQAAEEGMDAFITRIRAAHPGVEIVGKTMYGDLVDALQEYTENEEKPWIVILGNSGVDDNSLWMGSNVLDALRNLSYPVIAVPPMATYKQVAKICYACDFKEVAKHLPVQQLTSLVQEMNAELHVLNISNAAEADNVDIQTETEPLRTLLAPLDVQYHFVSNANTDEAIQQFLETNHMDWLLVIPHTHSFFEGLFHKSHTKAMVRMSHIPLAALHDKK